MPQQEEYDIWSPCPGSVCVVALDALTPASVHSLWRSPTLLNGLFLTILSRLRSSLRLVHLFLPHFSFHLTFYECALIQHFENIQLLLLLPFEAFVNDGFLHNCQVSSLPHDGEFYWTRLRPFKASGTLCRCFGFISWWKGDTLNLQYSPFSQYSNLLRFWIWGFYKL